MHWIGRISILWVVDRLLAGLPNEGRRQKGRVIVNPSGNPAPVVHRSPAHHDPWRGRINRYLGSICFSQNDRRCSAAHNLSAIVDRRRPKVERRRCSIGKLQERTIWLPVDRTHNRSEGVDRGRLYLTSRRLGIEGSNRSPRRPEKLFTRGGAACVAGHNATLADRQ